LSRAADGKQEPNRNRSNVPAPSLIGKLHHYSRVLMPGTGSHCPKRHALFTIHSRETEVFLNKTEDFHKKSKKPPFSPRMN
jgi:hypothetical protein